MSSNKEKSFQVFYIQRIGFMFWNKGLLPLPVPAKGWNGKPPSIKVRSEISPSRGQLRRKCNFNFTTITYMSVKITRIINGLAGTPIFLYIGIPPGKSFTMDFQRWNVWNITKSFCGFRISSGSLVFFKKQ